MNNAIYGTFMAIIATMSWAIGAILFKKCGERIEPIGLATFNTFFSFIILLVLLLITQNPINIGKQALIPIIESSILGIVIGDSLYYASLNRLSPIMLSIILLTGPFFSGIFGWIFFKEIPVTLSIIGIFTILIGSSIIIITSTKNINNIKTTGLGIFMGLSSLCLTSYSMAIVKTVVETVPTLTVTMYRMLFSFLALILYAIFSKKIFIWLKFILEKEYFFKLIGTIAIYAIGGFWCSVIAVKYCELVIATSIMSLEPFFVLLFMIIFYKYAFKKWEFFSIFCIVTGIILICYSENTQTALSVSIINIVGLFSNLFLFV